MSNEALPSSRERWISLFSRRRIGLTGPRQSPRRYLRCKCKGRLREIFPADVNRKRTDLCLIRQDEAQLAADHAYARCR